MILKHIADENGAPTSRTSKIARVTAAIVYEYKYVHIQKAIGIKHCEHTSGKYLISFINPVLRFSTSSIGEGRKKSGEVTQPEI